jgi:hypothetical protein
MIYLFGKNKTVSVIYAPETLTEQDKLGGIAVEALPPKEEKEGFYSVLCLDKDNKPFWEYHEIIKQPDEEVVV